MNAENERKLYLKSIKTKHFKVLTWQLIILVSFLIIWQLLADKNVINTFLCSSPKMILKTIIDLYTANGLLIHIWVTLKEILVSFTLGTLIGVISAAILWYFPFLSKVLDPYLTIINSLPKVALGPIIIIWAGANGNSIILMALLISTISTILAVYNGFNTTNKNSIKLFKSFHANRLQIFSGVVFPSNINTIISTLKINLSMTFVGVIMGELLVSKEGIGYLINYGSQVFNTNLVISGVIILCLLTSVLYFLILLIENKVKREW
ncbi:MAG: ABC transporter permease [Bacilli bacterium]